MTSEGTRRCLGGFTIGFLIGAGLFVFYGIHCINKNSGYSPPKDSYLILNRPGNLSAVSNLFIKNNISSEIHNNFFFTKLVIKFGQLLGYRLKMGEYSIPNNVSLWNAIKMLSTKKTVLHKFCIPEGFSVHKTLERLNKNKFLLGEITEIPEEGSLMPDTYCFRYPTTKQEILNQAKKTMSDFLEKEWKNRSDDCFLKTPEEALVLASIVERESIVQQDVIAGIYLNRLKIKMRLQSDPTVIYALTKGQKFSKKLTYTDLKYDSPYNTYRNSGLPPKPIANPGRKAILAVLHPKKSDWLYMYCARDMDNPVYSKTFKEHNRVKKAHKAKEK